MENAPEKKSTAPTSQPARTGKFSIGNAPLLTFLELAPATRRVSLKIYPEDSLCHEA